MNKLKPCPLCCDSTRKNMEVYVVDDSDNMFRAGCGSCGCSTPMFKKTEEATNFWNNRVDNPKDENCPMCDNPVEISEYTVHSKQIDPFYRYVCSKCHFASGVSKQKELIVESWISRGKK